MGWGVVKLYKISAGQQFVMLRIGHRGARAYEPENTLRSFKKALEIGVDAVEFDVRKTKDNKLVVIHDADVKRTTDGEGLVSELTLKEIRVFWRKRRENPYVEGNPRLFGQQGENRHRVKGSRR